MLKVSILLVAFTILLIVTTSSVAQDTPIERKSNIMVVFYNNQTQEVLGYTPYNANLVISENGVESDGINMAGIDWDIVDYGFYQYQDIPNRIQTIDGITVSTPWKLYELDLQPPDPEDLPHSQHIAQLTGVDVNRAKPLEVTRRFHGIEYTENCFVSQNVISLYQSGKLAIGDYVIVSYISETPNYESYELPIVVDKVFVSWE